MANYEKINRRITDRLTLVNEIKGFLINSGLFTLVAEKQYVLFDKQWNTNEVRPISYNMVFKHKDGAYFTFGIGYTSNNYPEEVIYTRVSNGVAPTLLDDGSIQYPNDTNHARMDRLRSDSTNYYAVTRISLPLRSMYLINTGNIVVFVFEVAGGVYLHHALGKYEVYGNASGGEFCGGTQYSNYDYVQGAHGRNSYEDDIATYTVHPFANQHTSYIGRNENHSGGGSFAIINNKYVEINALGTITSPSTQPFYQDYMSCYMIAHAYHQRGVNLYNGRSIMYPIEWIGVFLTSSVTKPAIPLMYTNEVCRLNVSNIDGGSIVDDKWLCFPLITKSAGLEWPNTKGNGVAYKIK